MKAIILIAMLGTILSASVIELKSNSPITGILTQDHDKGIECHDASVRRGDVDMTCQLQSKSGLIMYMTKNDAMQYNRYVVRFKTERQFECKYSKPGKAFHSCKLIR